MKPLTSFSKINLVQLGRDRVLQISGRIPERAGQLQVLVRHGVDPVVVRVELLTDADALVVQAQGLRVYK